MKRNSLKKMIGLGVTAALLFSLTACSQNQKKTEEIAGTADGIQIEEQKVTDRIQTLRGNAGLSEEDAWGSYLAQQGQTASDLRKQIVEGMIEQELVVRGAKEMGIEVSDDEVNQYYDKMKANYKTDDEWNEALSQAGFTQDSYKTAVKDALYQQKVNEHFKEESKPSNEDYLEAAKMYAPYLKNAKRTSHILFKVDDANNADQMAQARSRAEEVLGRIKDGSLDFAEAAKQYSGDTGSAEKGGDVGWDILTSFVQEYTDAIKDLQVDQVSGLVQSQYGIHIIKVTNVYNPPEDVNQITDINQIPEGLRNSIEEMAASQKSSAAYQDWLKKLKEDSHVEVKDMPSGLPYDVDTSKYASSSSTAAAAPAGTATAATGEATPSTAEAQGSTAASTNASSAAPAA